MHPASKHPFRPRKGFTLVEIVGVVALIAIIAAVVTPRVVSVISRGKVGSTTQSLGSLKTATMDYIGANQSLPLRDGTGAADSAVPTGRFDADLISAGMLDKLFSCAVGQQSAGTNLAQRTHVRSLAAVPAATIPAPTASAGGTLYDLDRNTSTVDFTASQMIVSAFIPGVALADAMALNRQIDGEAGNSSGADTAGRCLYSAPDSESKVTVYVYIAHY